jgi:hypothetical protein
MGVDREYQPRGLRLLDPDDPRPAKEQLDANYQHGGGWRPSEVWTTEKPKGWKLTPGSTIGGAIEWVDSEGVEGPYEPLAFTKIHRDVVVMYPLELVLILSPNGSFEICRMN